MTLNIIPFEFKTTEDYQMFMGTMSNIMRQIMILPLDIYIEKTNLADTIGPYIDPTLWMKAHNSVNEWLDLAKDLKKLKDKYSKLAKNKK